RADNPLTARVMVNRIWTWHFGEGLVGTPNNFGVTGDKPTHPELLDYLAKKFIESGWSIKAMHRLTMLSGTYQMRSAISDEALKTDPSDRLLSRFRQRRLTVEEMHDSLLAIDGSLDLTMGGFIAESSEPSGDEQCYGCKGPEKFVSNRRTIYLPQYRNKLT